MLLHRVRDDAKDRDGEHDAGDDTARRSLRCAGLMSFLSSAIGPRAHVVPLIVRIALGLVFVAAGALKLGHASDLAATITAFGLGLPPVLVSIAAVALPPLELLLGVYLIGGWLLPATSVAASIVLTVFILAVASVVARGMQVDCGCFGAADSAPATWWTVARDVLFLIPAVYLAWWSRNRDS